MTAPTQRRPYDEPIADDWTLVQRTQAGDREAFGHLYDRHNAKVFQYVLMRCGNLTVAQDLASDVWERALRGIGSLENNHGVPPIAWLLRIARNRAIDYFRSGRFRFEVVDEEAVSGDGPDGAAGVEDLVVSAEESRVLLGLVKQLPLPQQEAIALTYFLQLSSTESAAVMGKSPEAVKALTLRGRRSLARRLPADMAGSPS